MAGRGAWSSPSDLAEWAYCPRAHFYRHARPAGTVGPAARARRRRGTSYHARTLGAERRRAEHARAYALAVALGLALAAVGVVLLWRP